MTTDMADATAESRAVPQVTARFDLSVAGVGEPEPESNDQPEPEECTDE